MIDIDEGIEGYNRGVWALVIKVQEACTIALRCFVGLTFTGGDPPSVHKIVCVRIAGLPFHNVRFRCFVGQRDGRHLH